MSTKVLVTGGAGYVGSHVVDELVRNGCEVVVFDNLSAGHRQAVHEDAVLVEGDLLDREALKKAFRNHRFGAVIHMASYALVGESTEKPWLYLRDNVLAASFLLEESVTIGVRRIIFSSSCNIFGSPKTIPIGESESVTPDSPYGESKATIERQLYWMERLYDLKSCALRYFNAASAHPGGRIGEDHTPETHLIPRILQVALGQRSHAEVYGDDYETEDGTCVRDYVSVMDLARAHLLALESLTKGPGGQYNLGSGKGYSVGQVLEVARQVTGHEVLATVTRRRLGDPPVLVADNSAIRKFLGWKPEDSDLQSIIESAWNWHREHPHGYTGA